MDDPGRTPASRLVRVVAGAVLVVPAVAWWFGFSERFRYPKLLAGEGLAFLGLLVIASAGPALGGVRPRWRDWVWDLGVIGAVGSLWWSSQDRLTGYQEVSRLAALAAGFSIYRGVRDPWRLAPLIVAAAVINAMLAVGQALGFGLWETAREGRHAIYGTFGNPNMMAEYLGPALIVAVGWDATPTRGGFGKILRGVVAPVLLIAGAGLAGGRAALVGALTGYAVFVAMLVLDRRAGPGGQAPRSPAGGLEYSIGVLLLAATGWVLAARSMPGTGGVASADPTIGTRSLMARVAVHQFRERPWLGSAPGAYGLRFLETAATLHREDGARPAYAGVTREAHNDWLQLLAERGVAGLLLALLAGWFTVRGGARGIGGAAAAGVVVAIGVSALFGFPVRVMPTGLLLMWALACIADRDRAGPVVPRTAELTRAAVLGVGGLWLVGRVLVAESALGIGSESALRTGLRALPTHGELHFRYGLGLVKAGRLEDAQREFWAARPGFPDADVLFNLGWIALQRKDYPTAINEFSRGLELYPFFRAPAWADYALALRAVGRNDEARAAVQKALAIDPGLDRARALDDELNRPGRKGRSR